MSQPLSLPDFASLQQPQLLVFPVQLALTRLEADASAVIQQLVVETRLGGHAAQLVVNLRRAVELAGALQSDVQVPGVLTHDVMTVRESDHSPRHLETENA